MSCVDDNEIVSTDILEKDVSSEMSQFGLKIGNTIFSPVDTTGNIIHVCMPQNLELKNVRASFETDKSIDVFVNGINQISELTENDYTDIKNGVLFCVADENGNAKEYIVKAINSDLPVIFVTTPNCQPIVDKENWIGESKIKIWEPSRGITYSSTTKIKGRGNYTWTYPKKPYALKLDKKEALLGLSCHKRFCLLACWKGYIGNYYMAEVAKRCVGNPWVSKGKFVELIVNGEFLGLYYLSEQIKVDKNRVNIAELKPDDLGGKFNRGIFDRI
jgi:hypothetical protein